MADSKLARVAQLSGLQIAAMGTKDREVGKRIAADDLRLEFTAVDQRRPSAIGARDHVRRSDEEPVGGQDHGAAPAGRPAPAADAAHDPQIGDRRSKAAGDVGDHP